jgi:hypothetical protein
VRRAGSTDSTVSVVATDPDMSAEPLETRFRATTGTFNDPAASSATYACGAPEAAMVILIRGKADPSRDVEQTITIQCPDDIPINLCPKRNTVNAIPSNIPADKGWTEVQVRASDSDAGRLPLVTMFHSFRGSFDDPRAADTLYRWERTSLQELCAHASDGA